MLNYFSQSNIENYTLVKTKNLNSKIPEINSSNIKVWTIKKDEQIRINFVEIVGEVPIHKHPDAAHSLMVLSGKVKVQIGKEFIIINEGDYISIPADTPHKYLPLSRRSTLVSMDAPYYNPDKTIPLE